MGSRGGGSWEVVNQLQSDSENPKKEEISHPPQQVEVDEILEGGNFSNFQQIHTALFFVIFSVVFSPCLGAPAKHGRSS